MQLSHERTVSRASATDIASQAGLVDGRYQLLNQLGEGGVGRVFRALDRLSGRVVTLKRLRVPESGDATVSTRLLLAQEFRALASLRHPNIVSVLDFGFDADRQPYLTMDLEENAQTITEAARALPPAMQADLLVQLLRALLYLHRRGIIHRDLKPANVLVAAEHVKVVDFGLAILHDTVDADRRTFAGTLAYAAPELLRGEPVTPGADLYAVGLIAYEMFVGRYPFALDDATRFYDDVLRTPLPRQDDDVAPSLRPVLARLLAKHPHERYAEPVEVVQALRHAFGQSFAPETLATRESLIRAAAFVDRAHELSTLTGIVNEAARGRGGAWLVGGESGIGKTRLLEELRTRALVSGLIVVRGHAVDGAGGAHEVWRGALRSLLLRGSVDDASASVLKRVVPDVDAILGRDVPDPPALDAEAAQSRLALAVERLVAAQPAPVVMILEDLQWAGSESLALLRWLATSAGEMPLVVIGSYRDDDAADLPARLPSLRTLTLGRLGVADVAALGESMIGPAGRAPRLLALLQGETEGLPLFIVEAVRALAESAGGLERIGDAELPERLVSGGMQRMLRRRIERVPASARPMLEIAAVGGRVVDSGVLRAIEPSLMVEEWIALVAAAGVLEPVHEQWQFGHHKLREQVLADLAPDARRGLHRRVAEAIERVYPGRTERVAALALHWREAGEPTHELPYAVEAGRLTLESGACREAIVHLERARALLEHERGGGESRRGAGRLALDPNAGVDPQDRWFRLGAIEGALAEAQFRLGDLERCTTHLRRALSHFGQTAPVARPRALGAIAAQMGRRALQTLLGTKARDPARAQRVAAEMARAHLRLMEVSFYRMDLLTVVWSALRVLNQCVPAGLSSALAQGYVVSGMICFAGGARRTGHALCRRALGVAERIESSHDVAWVLGRWANIQKGGCSWADAAAGLERGAELAQETGDLRLWEECVAQRGFVHFYAGEFEPALARFREVYDHTARSENRQIACWGLVLQGDALTRLGRHGEGLGFYERAMAFLDPGAMQTEAICVYGMTAVARLHAGDAPAALEAARRALSYVVTTRPFAYWTQAGTAGTAETLLAMLEDDPGTDPARRAALAAEARAACRGLWAYARAFPLGRPHALVWDGLRLWLAGRPRRALRCWHAAVELAERVGTPYEAACAHRELGRHLSAGAPDRSRHLNEALRGFERLGCEYDAMRARALVAAA